MGGILLQFSSLLGCRTACWIAGVVAQGALIGKEVYMKTVGSFCMPSMLPRQGSSFHIGYLFNGLVQC